MIRTIVVALCAGALVLVPAIDTASAHPAPRAQIVKLEKAVKQRNATIDEQRQKLQGAIKQRNATIADLRTEIANLRTENRVLRQPPSAREVAETIQAWRPGWAAQLLGVVYENLRPHSGGPTTTCEHPYQVERTWNTERTGNASLPEQFNVTETVGYRFDLTQRLVGGCIVD